MDCRCRHSTVPAAKCVVLFCLLLLIEVAIPHHHHLGGVPLVESAMPLHHADDDGFHQDNLADTVVQSNVVMQHRWLLWPVVLPTVLLLLTIAFTVSRRVYPIPRIEPMLCIGFAANYGVRPPPSLR